jgi:uncharacterized repeat protein (TIGR04042 family)
MPEMLFHIVWPDGAHEACYSPSLVIKEHFVPGESYSVSDFLARSRNALTIASERVRVRYGMPCSRALGQLDRLERTASHFTPDPEACVAVERFEDL